MRFGDPVVGLRRRYSPRKPGGQLPTLRLPYNVFRPHCFRLAPLAENTTARQSVGYLTLSATPTDDGLEYQHDSRTIASVASYHR
jgi:hypothetical protein